MEEVGTLKDPGHGPTYDFALGEEQDTALSLREPGESGRHASLSCGHCGNVNPAGQRYCAHCGESLWEPCARCGSLCLSGENFCGACGANLAAVVQERIERFQADLLAVPQLQSEGRYDEAASLLESMAKADHPRLVEQARHAQRLLQQTATQREQAAAEAEAACQRAQDCLSACDYEGAQRILERVSLPLRSEAVQSLLEEANTRRQEVTSLGEQLQSAIGSGRLLDFLPAIERLLTLRPDHLQANQLLRRIEGRLCAVARQRLARHAYDDALKLLDRLPERLRTPESAELREQAAELAWLAWDLRHAPVVDHTLLHVAQRLQELAPDDRQAGKLSEELRRRRETLERENRRMVLPWATPPEHTHLRYPVDWATGFQRIVCAEKLDFSVLREHPGSFGVACGLALQGIGEARLRINLHPGNGRGLIGKIARAIRKPPRSAWGIDLGSSSLKAVRLTLDEKQGRAVLEGVDLIEHGKLLSQTADEEEEEKLVRATLGAFLSGKNLKADRICVGLPGRIVLGRELKLPPADPARQRDLVRYEVRHQLPFRLDELVWDYQVLETVDRNPPERQREAVLVAVKRAQAARCLARFQESGLDVDLMQSDCLALDNFVAYERFPGDADANRPTDIEDVAAAVLDLGGDGTNVVISSPRGTWSRSCGFGGYSFSRALVQEFHLTLAEAERWKRDPAAAAGFAKFSRPLQSVLEDLVEELRRSLDLFAKAHPRRKIGRILLLGGGCQLHGLLRYLRLGR